MQITKLLGEVLFFVQIKVSRESVVCLVHDEKLEIYETSFMYLRFLCTCFVIVAIVFFFSIDFVWSLYNLTHNIDISHNK